VRAPVLHEHRSCAQLAQELSGTRVLTELRHDNGMQPSVARVAFETRPWRPPLL
jgi:hypothetical protein